MGDEAMDKSERIKLKQLAVDVIVAYPYGSTQANLAEALERCVDDMEDAENKPHCGTCNCGDIRND